MAQIDQTVVYFMLMLCQDFPNVIMDRAQNVISSLTQAVEEGRRRLYGS